MKVAHARRHIASVSEMLAEHAKVAQMRLLGRDHPSLPETHMEFCYHLHPETPPELALVVGDAVHNLRAALDIMLCDVARVRGKSPKGVWFPFGEDQADLERMFEGKRGQPLRRLGEDIKTGILNLAPHKDGHPGLRGLHDLDVADKHKVVLTTFLVGRLRPNLGLGLVPPQIVDQIGATFLEAFGAPFENFYMTVASGQPWMLQKGINPHDAVTLHPDGPVPAFGPELPFAGEPVLDVLESLAQMAEAIVEGFAAHVGSTLPTTETIPADDFLGER
ncbi:MAG: hypothetical protein JHD15_07170 [Phenylobacterium sp.]|uniref:hypothetical protein n=1 Tax=Phenylobacterium sp. TaxID=1871053 RepID=UPI001A355F06|nr:hypothetical protein [Phenylobacterium sp.]MBJ7410134.1 hypothetical protein [Phenylobacterium sp.]